MLAEERALGSKKLGCEITRSEALLQLKVFNLTKDTLIKMPHVLLPDN